MDENTLRLAESLRAMQVKARLRHDRRQRVIDSKAQHLPESRHAYGELNPDPHYPLEVTQGTGQYTCAVPACTRHVYPIVAGVLSASFIGGERPGIGSVITAPNAPLSVTRDRHEYALGIFEKTPTGIGAVYYPAEETP